MPRIPSRPTVAPPTATPNQPNAALSREGGTSDRFEAGSKAVFEAYFTPYEPAQKAELAALDTLLAARRADDTVYPKGENPYRIDYAVYNLRSKAVIKRLIEAAGSGVEVRVLVEADQISPERPWNTVDEQFEEAGLQVMRSDKNTSLAGEAATLVGIDSNHLMHLSACSTGRIRRRVSPSSPGAVGFDEPG